MAASSDEPRVLTPFMPTLQHLASVEIAVHLFEELGVDTLEEAYTEIQQGSSTIGEYRTKSRRAKDSLLHIPAHLRGGVMKAVHGVDRAERAWMRNHYRFVDKTRNLHWRSDGSIDAVKTAQNRVQNAKFDIRHRFELACHYCLEDSVRALWREMLESGEAESFGMRHNEDMVSFWVGWLREQPQVPWTHSLIQFLETFVPNFFRTFDFRLTVLPRFSALLPRLQPEERQKCFHLLGFPTLDDLRFCLLAVTKKEEEQILKEQAKRVLRLHLQWPLQTLFSETALKLWHYIDDSYYTVLLSTIFHLHDNSKDFDYSQLFERFWNMSPAHLRKFARDYPHLRQRIDSYFDGKTRKRKSIEENKSNKKNCLQNAQVKI